MPAGSDPPYVSVVVPTYGRDRDYLRTAVRSVAEQTYDSLELLVVDDSPDGVAGAVREAADDIRLRQLRGGDHDGAAAARNTGIRAAEGRYVAFLDDDDWWDPTKLSFQVAAAETTPDTGLVVTGQRYVRDGEAVNRRQPEVSGDVTRALLCGARLCPFSTAMVDSEVIPDAGYVDERFPVWEDLEWYVRLSRHSRVTTVRQSLVGRRMGDHEQLTDGFERLRDEAYPRFREKHRPLAAEFGPGCERRFRSSLAADVAAAALSAERFGDARRFAADAVRADPGYARGYLLLAVATGGRPAYGAAKWGRRRLRGVFDRASGGVTPVSSSRSRR